MTGRVLLIGGVIAAVLLALSAGLIVLAALNLNRIIAANRSYLVSAVSGALGRRVGVSKISAEIGWGVLVEFTDVSVAEDPAFASTAPFFHAASVTGRVSVLPLLSGRVKVTVLKFQSAQVQIMRDAQGRFNFASLGKAAAAGGQPTADSVPWRGSLRAAALWSQTGGGPGGVKSVAVESLTLDDSQVAYYDALYATRLTLRRVNLTLSPLDPARACDLVMRMALLGAAQNLTVDGRVGPVSRAGVIDLPAAPLDLKLTVGPLVPDQLRDVSSWAKQAWPAASIPDPVSLKGTLSGSIAAAAVSLEGDLSEARVLYGGVFAKPTGVALKLNARGQKNGAGFSLSVFDLTLASLHATARDFSFAPGRIAGDIEAERFDLSPWPALIPALTDYRLSGSVEAHAKADVQDSRILLNGALKLAQVAATAQKNGLASLSDLDAAIDFTGDGATLKPASFKLGDALVTLESKADSLNPLRASYTLSSPQLSASDLIVGFSPKPSQARALRASGRFIAAPQGGLYATTSLTSSDGRLYDVPYRDLRLFASYQAGELKVQSLTLRAYDGAVDGAGAMKLENHAFEASGKASGIDLAQVAAPDKVASGTRGRLNGQATVLGRGEKLEQIEPTLRGEGRFEVVNGVVPGINPAAALLKALSDIPGLGRVFSPDLAARYPRVFRSPDMEYQNASGVFKIEGPQISLQNLNVVAADYTIVGGGWVNLDQRLDINADIILSAPFSRDLMQRNEALALMADGLSQVHVPLTVSGTVSKVSVRPDAPAALKKVKPEALENLGKKLLHNLFK